MKRLTYDFCIGGNHCWQIKGADNLECREVCRQQVENGCKDCPIAKAFDRLAAIEDILGDEYELDRLLELVEADRDGRCIISPCKTGDTVYFKTFTNNARKCLGICPHVVTAIKAHAEVKGEFQNVELPLSQFGDTWDLREEALKAREHDE